MSCWQFQAVESVSGVLLVAARRNSRGPWLKPVELPAHVRDYFRVEAAGVNWVMQDFKTLGDLKSVETVCWQKCRNGVKGTTEIPEPYQSPEIKRAQSRAKRWRRTGRKNVIWTIEDLANYVGASRPDGIGHRLYKDTECGIGFAHHPSIGPFGSIVVSGYCEGVDAECPDLEIFFPFLGDDFDLLVEQADSDGCDMWDQTHGCEDCGGGDNDTDYRPVDPNCKACGGHGVVI